MSLQEIAILIMAFLTGTWIIGMLYIYRSMEQSLDVLTSCLHHLIISNGVANASRVQSVAKDTEVEQ